MADPTGTNLTLIEAQRADLTDPVRQRYKLTERLRALREDFGDSGVIPFATLDLSTNPTATDTIDIGDDVYEFVATGGDVSDDANIGVVREGTAAGSFANLLDAINARDPDNSHDFLFQTDSTTPALANGTSRGVATDDGSEVVHLEPADAPGGTPVPSSPDIALDDALTAVVAWSVANLNLPPGQAASEPESVRISHVVTAAEVTAGAFLFRLPFTPAGWIWDVDQAGGSKRVTGADTLVFATDVGTVTIGGAAIAAGDIVKIHAWS